MTVLDSPTRLAALHRTGLLDSPPEEAFDRLTRLAANVLHASTSLLSLVDDRRTFFKSTFGMESRTTRETPVSDSFCAHVVQTGAPVVINDTRSHSPTADNRTIAMFGVVAYAGVPLLAPGGEVLGALCVFDSIPRRWSERDLQALEDLVQLVTTELSLRDERAARARLEEELSAVVVVAEGDRRRLQAVLEALPVGVWLSDAEGRITRTNPAAVKIWGGSAPQSATVEEFAVYRARVPGTEQPIAGADWGLARALRHGETSVAEALEIERFDGTRGHVLNSTAPVRDASGRVTGGVAVMLDVTAQAEAQRELDRLRLALDGERQRLSMLFEQAPAFIAWVTGPTHVFRGANQAYYQLVGFRDIIGKPVAEALPEVVEQGLVAALDRVLETGEPFTAEGMRLLIQRTPGAEPEERFANFVYQPIVEADGTRTGIFCHGVDVTDQVRAAMALREREQQHRALLDSLPVLVYHSKATPPYDSIFVNRAVERLGYPREEWLARPDMWQSLLHPEDRDRVLREAEQSFRSGEPMDSHYRMVGKSGAVHWFHDQGQFVSGEGEEHDAWQGIMVDTTAQRAAEDALRRSEERFRLAGQATREVIWDWDVRTQSLLWSDAVTSTFGHAVEEITSDISWWDDHIHPDDLAHARASINAVLEGNESNWTHQYRYRRGDGSYADVLDRGIVARDADGGPVRMVGSMVDLTDQIEAAAAIRFQAHLLDTVEQAVIAKDVDGRVTYWNACAERLYGYTAAEAVGRSIVDLTGANPGMEWEAHPGNLVAQCASWSGELPRRRKDGGVFTAQVSTSPICDPEGGVVGIVSVSVDATERRFLEEQLRQSQKMEAVGRLAGGVAHDFNNLLTVIRASTDFLLEEIDQVDPRREDVRQIANAAERATGLTRQLLAFSRKQMLDPAVLDLNVVVENLLPMLGRLIGEDVRVETALHPGVGKVMADVGQLEQVLVNLVVNARDAMPDGGRVTIATHDVTLDDRFAATYAEQERSVVLPGDYVMLTVSDSGLGMTPEVRARVFEPFYTTKETGKGTGLGLSTVYGIVKQSGGHIWVYSEPGEGTVFKLYFPRLGAPAATSLERTAGERPRAGSETVLLVEDEDQLRTLARRILQRQGYRVLESRNGREALACATQFDGQIHLVLTDVVMPELSGRGLVERLRAVRPQAAVIYMSGYTDDDVLRRGMLETGSRFVQKPFAPTELLRMVREALDERA